MYGNFGNNTCWVFSVKQKLFKYICSAAVASLLIFSAGSSFAVTSDPVSVKGIDSLFEKRDFATLLKNNKAEVLKKGRSKLVIDSNKLDLYKEDIQSRAVDVIDTLQLAGFEAYIVGGAVRDLLSGKTPKDYDVCTNATADEVVKLFRGARKIGKNYSIVRIDYDGEMIEVAPFSSRNTQNSTVLRSSLSDNKDGASSATPLALDSDRRDLTINAIYFDINNAQLIDFHGGIYDLRAHVINTIADAATIYKQDPVRMLRVLRFAAKLNFSISDEASYPILDLAPYLSKVHPQRMFAEVNKLFLSGHSAESYKLLNKYDVIRYLFPGLDAKVATPQHSAFLKDVVAFLDEDHAHGIQVKPYVMFAYMLWPVFSDKLSYMQENFNEYSQDQLSDWACSKVLSAQSKATALRNSTPDDICAIWKMQLQLVNIKDVRNAVGLTSDPSFISAFELLRLRSLSDKSIKGSVKFWQPYYDEKVMLSFKTH